MLTKKQIAVVHVAKNQLGLDEESYRDVLANHGGVSSSKQLGYKGFKAVMAHFEKSGFIPKNKSKRDEHRTSNIEHPTSNEKTNTPLSPPSRGDLGGCSSVTEERPGMATTGQIKKIYALWWTLSGTWYQPGKEWKALRGFLRARFRVDHENFLKFKQAHKVIEALKQIGKRESRKHEGTKTRKAERP